MSLVKISNLRKLYGSVIALSNIDITIESGTFFTLLGPSGCGKTTLLRTIAGFIFQDAGTIEIGSKSLEKTPAHKRDVGMVFQDYAIFPHLSVNGNIAFGLKQQKLPQPGIKKRIAEVLRVVQLEDFADRMPHELSGGQQQRVGLARAIVTNPTVLLMDEPLSNLDAKLRISLRAELRRIQKKLGMTTIYVTHDQEEALAMSDVVCVMYNGVIQQAASPIEIYKRPANRFVANFVGGNNFLRTKVIDRVCWLETADVKLGKFMADAPIVAAVRPESIIVHVDGAPADDDHVSITVNIEHISFIGREMEVHGYTQSGESIKAVSRSNESVLSQGEGSPAIFAFRRDAISFFEDSDTGRLIT